MTMKDVFGLIVRTVGLLPILYGLFDAVGVLFHLLGISPHHEITASQAAAAAVSYITLGVVIIWLANPITRLVYGRDRQSS